MDKQKQIEEIEKDIAIRMAMAKSVAGSMNNGVEGWLSEYLIERGWAKIPENAVVLSREEYQQHKGFSREEVDEISETAIKNSRKNTVDKFAEKVHNLFNRDIKDSVVYTQEEKDILKDFVESIDEIAEEITEGD